jgi:resuscitation-promoting factor RpfB
MSSKVRILLLLSAVAALALAAGYLLTGTPVTVSVDGAQSTVHTRRATVGDVLADLGLRLASSDIVTPTMSTPLQPGTAIVVSRAQSVTVLADGHTYNMDTHAQTAAAMLREAGVQLNQRDLVFLNGQTVDINNALRTKPAAASGSSLASFGRAAIGSQQSGVIAQSPSPLTISVRRAVSISISDVGTSANAVTAARVVGDALFGEGIYIYAADIVTPTLDTAVSAGMTVTIQRAKPVTIIADGRTFSTRTQAKTVAALLIDEGIPAQNKDFTTPGLQSQVTSGMTIAMTRVREDYITESEGIAFKTTYQPDANLELDQQRIVAHGKRGVFKRSIRIVYENGKEVTRVVDREWTDEEPTTQIIAYGTKIVIRTLSTPDGPIEYWRAVRVWATFYTPLTSGTPLDAPYFGITFTGKRATKGIIAVDPSAIRLHTGMYLPGYGFGAAEDTGNLVTGMVIDLCYDDDASHPERWTWARWTTAYLLTPVPGNIPYILPDFPREPT